MLHLRTDWQGIQDTHQWLLTGLWAIDTALQEGSYDLAGITLGTVLSRMHAALHQPSAESVPASSSILDDEPVFMVRSKSEADWNAVLAYAMTAEAMGSDAAYVKRLRLFAQEMQDYAESHFPNRHAPDAPELLPG